jgi:bisanhydrobacterioruberin hydratase
MTVLRKASEVLNDGFVQPARRKIFLVVLSFSCVLFPFSLLFIVGGVLPAPYQWTASVIIILNAAATFLSELREASLALTLRRASVILLVLYAIEFIGVTTGYPFGSYVYTDVLGFSVAGIPLAISFAWYATVMNTWRMSEGLMSKGGQSRAGLVALGAGMLTLALDIALEPMASMVNAYWRWRDNTIPLQNYLSWFFLTLIAVYLLSKHKPVVGLPRKGLMRTALLIYGMQIVLFAATAVRNGYTVPAVIAMSLCALTLFAVPVSNLLITQPSPQQE